MSYIFVYTTNPNRKTAERIAKILINKKLIACANIFPIYSVYKWNGKLTISNEIAAIYKTEGKYFKRVQKEIEMVHPYKTPCITKINIEPNKKYRKWMEDAIFKKTQ